MPIDLGNLCLAAPERPAGHHYLVSLDEALAHLDNMRLRRGERPNPVVFLVTQGQELITSACKHSHQHRSLTQPRICTLWVIRHQKQVPGKDQLPDLLSLARLSLLDLTDGREAVLKFVAEHLAHQLSRAPLLTPGHLYHEYAHKTSPWLRPTGWPAQTDDVFLPRAHRQRARSDDCQPLGYVQIA